MRRLIVWGAGELGGRVAAKWARAGGEAIGYTASKKRHKDLKKAGVVPRIGEPKVDPEDALLLSLPGSDNQAMAVAALSALPAPARCVLTSSTGYYGHPPKKIDEGTAPANSLRAAKVLGAEAAFRAWTGDNGVVLRFGGLYRSGRGPLSSLKKRGHAPLGPPDRALALIHYEDAAEATFQALRHPTPQPTYLCVVTPVPTRQEFYLAGCVLLDLPLPAFESPLNRRLTEYDTSRMQADLLPEPAHPRWQEVLVPKTKGT